MLPIPALVIVAALVALLSPHGYAIPDGNPDIELKTPDLIEKYGYPVEIHKVVTEDGYILELHRIPSGLGDTIARQRPPVLLQHGLAGSSADWVIMGPGKSLAYLLADEGYDVWLGNNRGNVYSRNHTTMLPTDKTFWNFRYTQGKVGFHELGINDLPSMIDYIIARTNAGRILYVGHSQGTTQFLVLTSERPSYNAKIALMVGLAPAAYTGNVRGPFRKLAELTYFGVWVGENFGYPEFRSRSDWAKFVSNLLCKKEAPTQFLCGNVMYFVTGFSHDESNLANLTVIIGHVPAGASWKQFVHFGQGIVNPGTFRRFDYTAARNLEVYNSVTPPDYNLENVIAPVALFSSDNDLLATPPDVKLLSARLKNIVWNYNVSATTSGFNHYDFIWGIRAPQLVFEPLLGLLEKYR